MLKRVAVKGNSMEPTLREGQKLLVYKTKRLKAGDVAVLKHPYYNIKIVKRVVGVLENAYTVAGDNKNASTDSTHYGPVDRKNVIGRVLFSYAPPRRVR